MTTETYSVTKDEWVMITSGSAGSLFAQKGGKVALAQATTKPAGSVDNTPLLDIIKTQQSKVYYAVPAEEAIYARALTKTVQLTNTPAAV